MHTVATAAVLAVALSGSAEGPQLTRNHSLSECIADSPVIVLGKVRSLEDQDEAGVLRTTVLKVFKGNLTYNEAGALTLGQTPNAIAIADWAFHSERNGSLADGPAKIEEGETYIFFLSGLPDEKRQYRVPFPADGVVLPSRPVNLEIQRQVEKAQSDHRLTESEVLKMADRFAAERRSKYKTFDLTSFQRQAEFDAHRKVWNVRYLLAPESRESPIAPGSDHFSITVDDRTGELKYFGGR